MVEVYLDLLELLHELGYLDGSLWTRRDNPQAVARLLSREGNQVVYLERRSPQTASVREFLQWFELQTKTPSDIRGGDI